METQTEMQKRAVNQRAQEHADELAKKSYEEMTDEERYELMNVPMPALTISKWFAREKIILHRQVNSTMEVQDFVQHVMEEYPRALRLIEFLEERLAVIMDSVADRSVEDACAEVLSIDMETF